jgi:putative ABC transport system permease protein
VNLVTLALRNLRRRGTRTIVVALSVGLAVGSALSLLALGDSVENGAREGIDERSADFTVFQRDAPDLFSGFIPEEMEKRIAQVPGIAAVAGELIAFAPVEQDFQRIILGWSTDAFFWQAMPVAAGRAPGKGERRIAVLGVGAAESLDKQVGDDLDIMDERFRVVAVASYASALNRSAIVLPLADLQELAFRGGQVTAIHLQLGRDRSPSTVARITRDVEGLGRLAVTPTDSLIANDRNITILKAISKAVSLIALTISALSILNVLLMAVQERTREIGVMMAIGWDKPHIMMSIVLEGIVIGAAGSAIGVVFGYVASFSFSSIPAIGDYLAFRPTVGMMLQTPLFAVALCALGSLYPAWRATSLIPAEAIRKL